MSNKLWFRAKTYGMGWYPITWQGWVITLTFVVLVILSSIIAEYFTQKPWTFLAVHLTTVGILLIILFVICIKKGEPLRWRWGE